MLRSTISATLLALMFGAQSLAEPPPVSLAVEGPGSALARGDEGTLRLIHRRAVVHLRANRAERRSGHG